MNESNYKIPLLYVSIVNNMMNSSYCIDDFVTLKHEGGYKNDVFVFGDKYILKVYHNSQRYTTERDAVGKLDGCCFLAGEYHFDDKYMLMSCPFIEGETLQQFWDSKHRLPSNFLDDYFGIQIEMAERGLFDEDFFKMESLIWISDSTVKKYDFDVVNMSPPRVKDKKDSLQRDYEKLKQGSLEAWNAFAEKFCIRGIPRSCFDEYRSKL